MNLRFRVDGEGLIEPAIRRLVLAGFAGREPRDVEAHIEEMARHGVKRPTFVPSLWPVMPHLLTQAASIEVFGADTAPEVEYVLFTWRGETYVTVGNDQCDIAVERDLGADKSKNLCQKVVALDAWGLEDVRPHWDELVLTLACNGSVMQEGKLAGLLRPDVLLDVLARLTDFDHEARMVFSGTIATNGAYPPGPYRLDFALTDPVRERSIAHTVTVEMLQSLH
ncbi:MAG: DUF2848 family protein [Pseudomonadota bacterium]|nr:DUF2848 family protein [Pseudomonadota bacterium]